MPVETAGFREAHGRLSAHADDLRAGAARLPTLSREERTHLRDELLDLLHTSIEPHTKLNEHVLYPAVGDALEAASLEYDHVAIRHWIAELESADADDVPCLQELLYGLDALIRVHLWKENELFIGALEAAAHPPSG